MRIEQTIEDYRLLKSRIERVLVAQERTPSPFFGASAMTKFSALSDNLDKLDELDRLEELDTLLYLSGSFLTYPLNDQLLFCLLYNPNMTQTRPLSQRRTLCPYLLDNF